MDQNHERRRGHFHRGRRGPDRRATDRRPPQQAQEHTGRDHVDVEQIMRDLRARIAQRHGIELSSQQIQELAARRLESILDPRAIKPALMDQLRRAAGSAERTPAKAANPPYTFEDVTLYESHRGVLRFIRRLLNPLLKLFFNPNPLVHALNVQARLNVEAAERESERDQRLAEWNALHYEIVQRLVTEVSRVSLELQAQSMRIEALAAKVDFNDRRVRSMEGVVHRPRPSGRAVESPAGTGTPAAPETPPVEAAAEAVQADGAKRRRRRRRGRRGGAVPGETAPGGLHLSSSEPDAEPEETSAEPDVPEEASGEDVVEIPVTAESESGVHLESHEDAAAGDSGLLTPPVAAEPPAAPEPAADPPDSDRREP